MTARRKLTAFLVIHTYSIPVEYTRIRPLPIYRDERDSPPIYRDEMSKDRRKKFYTLADPSSLIRSKVKIRISEIKRIRSQVRNARTHGIEIECWTKAINGSLMKRTAKERRRIEFSPNKGRHSPPYLVPSCW